MAQAHRRASRLIFPLSALVVLIGDQATKLWAEQTLEGGRSVPIIGSTLRLSLVHNTGAAFGLLSSSGVILMVLATVAVLLFAIYGRRVASDPLRMGAMGLLLGGTLGNLSDRVRFGHVIDFIELSFWPTFNVADIAITIGAVLLALSLLRGHGTSPAAR